MIERQEGRPLLNCRELAQKFNVPVNTVYYWVSKKEIPYIKVGKHNRFNYQEVMEFFKKQTVKWNVR
ncbi:MAG: helix-turn-helix domain-containing protein [Bdellovibrio sp.]|nr:helix-turn-helix domain-containing protein [Bdellovibrio sp.]